MSQLFNGSICLSDIPKDKIVESTKNGKKYLNVVIWLNDEEDKYKNIGSIQVSQTKDEREAKATKQYIGNFKKPEQKQEAPQENVSDNIPIDDLPF
jgi:hypothetical protein